LTIFFGALGIPERSEVVRDRLDEMGGADLPVGWKGRLSIWIADEAI
jgi:hypothetical protein